MYQKIAPMLLVENVDEALAWYRDSLGAKIQHSLPESPPFTWVSLLLDSVEIMLSEKGAAQEWYSTEVAVAELPSNFLAYIYVEDALDLYSRLKSKTRIALEPTDQFYGIREFAIRDPFGFVLIFAQVIG